jgi:dienelactone hydrolase
MMSFARTLSLVCFISVFGLVQTNSFGRDVVESKKMISWDGHNVEWYQIPDKKGGNISYILILPDNKTGKKFPCVIDLHGITGSKWESTDIGGFTKGGNVTELLLEEGYAVFAIDYDLHGDRAEKVYGSYDEHFSAATNHWDEFYEKTVGDIYTSIEYIKNRPEIDPSRLGLMGYSVGCVFSLEVGKRGLPGGIKTVILCVPPQIDKAFPKDGPKPKNGVINQFVPLVKAPSLLMLVGNHDPWSSLTESRNVFSNLNITDKKIIEFDSGHSLPLTYPREAVKWIKERI